MVLKYISNLWFNLYKVVSAFIYPDDKLYNTGRQQLLQLEYPLGKFQFTHSIYTKSDNIYRPVGPQPTTYYVEHLQVLTWNIHHGLNWFMRPRLKEIAEYLLNVHYNVDVICLQEANTTLVSLPNISGKLVNQATYIATYLGYNCYYHNDLAILTKAPIIAEFQSPIFYKSDTCNNAVGNIIGCTISINNIPIKIYNCHLPNDITGVSQLQGITNMHNGLLAKLLDDTYNNHPVILTGDFNCNQLFSAIQKLKKITTHMTSSHPSYPIIMPLIQIDHILTNGEWIGGLKILTSAADYNCSLSDHYPIEALISLPSAN